jgi:tetratricopeptide (TPR) repeat protein
MKLRHDSGLAILRNVIKGISPKKAGRQEAHVFNFYTMMKRIAATAALGALVVAGTLQPAHAQGAAAPAKTYKEGEFQMYDGALKALVAGNFTKAIADAEAWKQKVPDSDYKNEREVVLIQAHYGAKQYDKVLANAEPLLNQDLDKLFPDPVGGPGQVIPVLRTCAASIQVIPQPTPQQLATAEKAARVLATYDRKPQGIDDAAWGKNKQQFAAEANAALMYIAVVPGANALAKNDCDTAQNLLSKAASAYPNNSFIAYQLGLAYRCTIKATPAKADEYQPKAIYQFIRALVIDPSIGGTQDAKKMSDILTNMYVNYHGGPDGLEELKAAAKTNPMPPANFTIESSTSVSARKEKEFESQHPQLAMWLKIKGQLASPEGPSYFENQLKNAAVPKMKGTVVEGKPACRSKELLVSVPEPNQQNAPTVITLKLDAPLTGKPTAGEIQWEGVPSAFTADPFMLTMDTEKAKIEKLQVTPCTAAPAARPSGKKSATPKKK